MTSGKKFHNSGVMHGKILSNSLSITVNNAVIYILPVRTIAQLKSAHTATSKPGFVKDQTEE